MFKLVVLLAAVVAVSCDVSHLFNKPSNNPFRTPFAATQQRAVPVARAAPQYQQSSGNNVNVEILRQESEIEPEGSYRYSYETANGISAQEQASIKQVGKDEVAKSAQGSFSWTSPEGQPIQISYIADENGYQPQGDLPTPPPIPAAIQRALEWIASHPQQPEPARRF